jgi:predicted DNA-binding protein (MmcQ/YjbR family)
MDLESLQKLALSKAATSEDIKWDTHLCFNVAEKIFLITSPDNFPIDACFKVSEEDFDFLTTEKGFIQAPHFAKRKWIKIQDINLLSFKEWSLYLEKSYRLVAEGLSKKKQIELGII